MQDKYCIIVGKGDLPKSVINSAKSKGVNFILAGIKSVSPYFVVNSHEHFWFHLGMVEDLISKIKSNGCNKIVFAGAMKRPSFFSLKYDNLGKKIAFEMLKNIGGDNNLLSKIISIFESYGLEVIPPHIIAPKILSQAKQYTTVSYSKSQVWDVVHGFKNAKFIGDLDIGQGVIMQNSVVVSVEALEGTANMIKRSKKLIKNTDPRAVLIKVKKDFQTDKADLPTIGKKTIKQLYKSNISGIVIEANNSIILNEEETIDLANQYGIFIVSLSKADISNLENNELSN